MAAFRAAVRAGAHALEMDLQLTKDNVVVISHDPTLQSQFGRPGKIADHDWADLSDVKTLAPPHEPMPRFIDVLAWLSQPQARHIWILVEIKVGGSAERLMQCAGLLLQSFTPSLSGPWQERIVFTVLPHAYLVMAAKHLTGFPVAHIGFSKSYIQNLLPVPGLALNIALPLLVLPGGSHLLSAAHRKHNKPVYAWVVNDEETMKWCVRRGLDGVLCDDPKKFMGICRAFDQSAKEPWFPLSINIYWSALLAVVTMAWRAWTKRKFLSPVPIDIKDHTS